MMRDRKLVVTVPVESIATFMTADRVPERLVNNNMRCSMS
jgi:hypothetical protein